uniref:Cytochrome b5 heme-binding domain-containing protein n=1 Tax=Nelumbo nucifera TaxID=4432 RepID=A0A822ZCX2_NELNU|nr:TPA_asm: hypothetical protein HUJ06_000633 [Nelumbo nucifera]
MADDDDFTFCQVAPPANQDGLGAEEILPKIGGITMKDNLSNSAGVKQKDGILWKDQASQNASFKKQGTVGSLSFNVTDTSPPKPSSESSKQNVSTNVGASAGVPQEQKTVNRKPVARAKVPFEKGFSQVDWLRLTNTHPDLAGLKGKSNKRLISMEEVKQHQTEGSVWTVLKGRVYNISPYMKFHPGGIDMLMKAAGKDCTSLFSILLWVYCPVVMFLFH